ncbi:hypothetical protein ACJBU6_09943 [Exserohilum turcicum]
MDGRRRQDQEAEHGRAQAATPDGAQPAPARGPGATQDTRVRGRTRVCGATAHTSWQLTEHCSLIAFTDKEPKDWMVPSRWGTVRLHPGARALSTSATIPTRHNRATAAVSSCRQRARCRWSCPLTAFLRGVGLRQSDLFLLVLEEVDNTQRTQSLDTVSRRGKRNYRTGLMFLSPNVYIKTRMRSSLLGLLRVSFFSLFLFFFLMVGGFLLGVHDEIKALA